MLISRTNLIALVTLWGIGIGCNESTERSTPPPGDALPKPSFRLGDWCQSNLSLEEQRTLDALIQSIGASTCAEFEYRYANMGQKRISIAYEDLSDPSLLLALNDLQVLSIRGNKFTNISWTKSLESLVALDASDNPLGSESAVINTENLGPKISELTLDGTGVLELLYPDEPSLIKLSLAGNGIEDLSFLTDLISLESLHLPNNAVLDVSPLTQLEKLKYLSLATNPLTSVAPLANLSSLKELGLADVHLDVSLSSAQFPSQLETVSLSLSTEDKKTLDLSELATLASLRTLDASGRQLIGSLANDSNLTELILERAVVPNVELLKKLPDLQMLNIKDAGLLTLPHLERSLKLTNLIAGGNPLTLVDGLRLPSSLRVLNLDHCQVSEFRRSEALSNLVELSLRGNKVKTIVDFNWPTELLRLDLSENSISHLPDLSALGGLTNLNLSRNQIKNPTPLAVLIQLEQLDLSHNQLAVVTPLAPLLKLTLLDVRSNGLASTTVCPVPNTNACLF